MAPKRSDAKGTGSKTGSKVYSTRFQEGLSQMEAPSSAAGPSGTKPPSLEKELFLEDDMVREDRLARDQLLTKALQAMNSPTEEESGEAGEEVILTGEQANLYKLFRRFVDQELHKEDYQKWKESQGQGEGGGQSSKDKSEGPIPLTKEKSLDRDKGKQAQDPLQKEKRKTPPKPQEDTKKRVLLLRMEKEGCRSPPHNRGNFLPNVTNSDLREVLAQIRANKKKAELKKQTPKAPRHTSLSPGDSNSFSPQGEHTYNSRSRERRSPSRERSRRKHYGKNHEEDLSYSPPHLKERRE